MLFVPIITPGILHNDSSDVILQSTQIEPGTSNAQCKVVDDSLYPEQSFSWTMGMYADRVA